MEMVIRRRKNQALLFNKQPFGDFFHSIMNGWNEWIEKAGSLYKGFFIIV